MINVINNTLGPNLNISQERNENIKCAFNPSIQEAEAGV